MEKIDLSFIFPCLNEEATVRLVINELNLVLNKMDISAEIILADNGSTDSSVLIAQECGGKHLRVINAPKKGYGEALKAGFNAAKGEYLAFADIDGSYPLEFLPKMYKKAVEENADMVVASRMTGKIEKGAMPFLHHYLGTPVLTKIINILFAGKLSDCNSGFRLFKKKAYKKWNVFSSGMEFASELLIKALKHKSKIVEIPAGLRVDKRSTSPHLSTWRDGMRHLLFILSEAPNFFEKAGLFLILVSTLLEILSCIFGPVTIGQVSIFDYHSKLLFLIGQILGIQCFFFSISLFFTNKNDKPTRITQMLINLKEETLFFILLATIILIICGMMGFVIYWALHGYHNIFAPNSLIDMTFVLSSGLMFCSELMQIHILRRRIQNK